MKKLVPMLVGLGLSIAFAVPALTNVGFVEFSEGNTPVINMTETPNPDPTAIPTETPVPSPTVLDRTYQPPTTGGPLPGSPDAGGNTGGGYTPIIIATRTP